MSQRWLLIAAGVALVCSLFGESAWGAGDPARGAALFQACMACHAITPGEQMTGPSLAKVWQRKAGTVPGFERYSDAMQHSNVVWTAEALDRWLTNPEAFLPGTSMTFPGIRDKPGRDDVIAYLQAVSEGTAPTQTQRGGGMMNMQSAKGDLKKAPAQGQVIAISHCRDTYIVKTADGKMNKAWEFNLRFKTDSSALGPQPGKPVIVGAGMQGDRASVVFANPGEISGFIKEAC